MLNKKEKENINKLKDIYSITKNKARNLAVSMKYISKGEKK